MSLFGSDHRRPPRHHDHRVRGPRQRLRGLRRGEPLAIGGVDGDDGLDRRQRDDSLRRWVKPRMRTGWQITLSPIFCWLQSQTSILVYRVNTKTQPLFWCQRKVMSRPVVWLNLDRFPRDWSWLVQGLNNSGLFEPSFQGLLMGDIWEVCGKFIWGPREGRGIHSPLTIWELECWKWKRPSRKEMAKKGWALGCVITHPGCLWPEGKFFVTHSMKIGPAFLAISW